MSATPPGRVIGHCSGFRRRSFRPSDPCRFSHLGSTCYLPRNADRWSRETRQVNVDRPKSFIYKLPRKATASPALRARHPSALSENILPPPWHRLAGMHALLVCVTQYAVTHPLWPAPRGIPAVPGHPGPPGAERASADARPLGPRRSRPDLPGALLRTALPQDGGIRQPLRVSCLLPSWLRTLCCSLKNWRVLNLGFRSRVKVS